MKVNFTLTDEQANLLVCYIIQTTTHRRMPRLRNPCENA